MWSGDGGSVGVGHVYIQPAIVERLQEQDWTGAIEAFLTAQRARVVLRVLQPPWPRPCETSLRRA